jgi:3-phenylpropionate/trans-cinnamate dioxygenase ferredoxin subunit
MTEENARWIEALPLSELADSAIRCIRIEGVDLLLVRHGERIAACERACPHEQADLGLGRISEGRLFCPRHFASFDLDDGHISAGWPARPLRLYPVRIISGHIWIDVVASDDGRGS